MTRESVVCGPDVERHVDAFTPYVDAGYDEVYVANMARTTARTSDPRSPDQWNEQRVNR